MFANPTFWTAVAFFIFFAILGYYGVHRKVTESLDARARRIDQELAEARRLRGEAEALLADYEAKRAGAEREASAILDAAREEAERLAAEAHQRTADFVARRTAAAEAKIAQAEAQATAEVRAAAAEAAVRASERILREDVTGATADDLLARSLADVRAKLNS